MAWVGLVGEGRGKRQPLPVCWQPPRGGGVESRGGGAIIGYDGGGGEGGLRQGGWGEGKGKVGDQLVDQLPRHVVWHPLSYTSLRWKSPRAVGMHLFRSGPWLDQTVKAGRLCTQ
jgi:hypothetical protein